MSKKEETIQNDVCCNEATLLQEIKELLIPINSLAKFHVGQINQKIQQDALIKQGVDAVVAAKQAEANKEEEAEA